MGKLYIPTSTLNFNNILATESISPESFYLNREFGYKRFTKVEPNPLPNSIIAYNKLPIFKIKESDFDDYPLIIEISSELINKDTIGNTIEKNGIKIFQISKTFYLHPSKTKFIFFNKKERSIALTKAEPSIETKLLPVYRNSFELIDNNYDSFQWDKSFIENIQDLTNDKIQENIRYDLMINKLKGFYYSYFLGIILSLTKREKKIRKDIYSISQLLSKLSNKNTFFSNSSINELREVINKLQIISSDIEKEINFNETNSISQIAEISFNGLKITQLSDSFFKEDEAEIYRSIINDIFEYSIHDVQTFQEEKSNLVFEIGVILKDYYSDWDKSKERKYLNGLIGNIDSYQPFNIKSHSSILLQSIALFILKGEDPDKLIESLSKNQIVDYRTTLGLWGSIFGFSALPKTLTNILFSPQNIKFTRLFYQDVQTKLHTVKSEEKIIIEKDFKHNKISPEEPLQEKINEDCSKTSQKDVAKCPKCGAEMRWKTVNNGRYRGYGFWGCKNYKPNNKGCNGKRDEQLNELDDNFNPVIEDKDNKYAKLIYEYVKIKHHCKINPDIIDYISKETGRKLQNKKIKSIVNEKLSKKLEYKKIGRSDAYKIRE